MANSTFLLENSSAQYFYATLFKKKKQEAYKVGLHPPLPEGQALTRFLQRKALKF
jgi:hypothetical protein